MSTRLAKWGNSIALRLPSALIADAGLKPGSRVDLIAEGNVIKIVPKSPKRRYRLEDLLARMTPENIQPEVDWGPDVGREILE